MSNGDRLSNPSFRRSSFSQPRQPPQMGHSLDMEAIPKVLETFILAVFKHSQSSQHLKNVETDYESMLPRHNEFPALGTQRVTRLNQARDDFKTTEAQTAEATKSLLVAFKAQFQSGSTSHQDCVSHNDLNKLSNEIRASHADAHEVEQILQQNDNMKRALKRTEDRLDHEIHARKRLEDRVADLEDLNRGTTRTINSTCEKYKSLEESTTKDRLSFRNRCTALEAEMENSKTKHKELDDYIDASKAKFDEQARTYNLCRQNVETLQQKRDTDVDARLNQHSETLSAARKDLQELKDQAIRPPVSLDTIPNPVLETIDIRLKAAEKSVLRLKEDADGENSMIITMVADLQSDLDQLQAKMNELQTINEEKIQHLKVGMDTQRAALEGVPEDLKPHLDYLSNTVESHIDLLQRHEVRLNSVTTDELYRQMESQFRHSYGVPNELRGIIQRQSKVEAMYKNCHEAVNNLHSRIEAMATELRGSKCMSSSTKQRSTFTNFRLNSQA